MHEKLVAFTLSVQLYLIPSDARGVAQARCRTNSVMYKIRSTPQVQLIAAPLNWSIRHQASKHAFKKNVLTLCVLEIKDESASD